jgi:D-lactate dehydrogenase
MPDALIDDLRAQLPNGSVLSDHADRLAWANDASIYRLVPRVVVLPRQADDVATILRIASARQVPVCFRAGGTSLSGQAITDGILIVISRHLRGIEVLEGGAAVRCQPGAVGSWVNAALAPHGQRIGPDPASIQAAEIGGIVANNASGMCCGIHENSYQTVIGMELLLADGSRIDTTVDDSVPPRLASELLAMRDAVQADQPLAARIRAAFATKNTVGYSLNAFLDADTPAGILQRLVVGSEGTLAFIASATFRTLPMPRCRATGWLVFRDIEAASAAVAGLADSGAVAVELLDAVALRRVADKLPDPIPDGEPAALLIEYQETDETALADRLAAAQPMLSGLDLAAPAALTRDSAVQAKLWAIRKGLFPSVGAVRALGTAVVIEDVTFPVTDLATGVRGLRTLFDTHGYADAVIFGHAKDGNLHFTLTPDLSQPAEVQRYDAFMRELVAAVLAAGGHLKAEHGTGRNMAPFVSAQWGEPAVALMRRIKAALDPHGILNPGVLLSDDPQAHLAHLKTMPAADPLVDRCIECGFCEPTCPSRDATLSPRQRIVQWRNRTRGGADAAAIDRRTAHDVLDTCAGDGLCASACPVGIDTGELVRAQRAIRRGALTRWTAQRVLKNFALIGGSARLALHVLGGLRLPGRVVPIPPAAPAMPRRWPVGEAGAPRVALMATCLSRTFGPDPVLADLARLCEAAGVGIVIPERVSDLCCGQPFASKGFPEQARAMAQRTVSALLATGCTSVLIDTGTCASFLHKTALPAGLQERWNALSVHHPAAFAAEILIPRLQARKRLRPGAGNWVLHPTCSEQKAGWAPVLLQACNAVASARIPAAIGCCGTAGDKAWNVPELTAAATARESAEVRAQRADLGISTSLTCGASVAAASGLRYRHLFSALADRLT